MIATALAASAFAWSYAITCTSIYGAARAFLHRRRAAAAGGTPLADVACAAPPSDLVAAREPAKTSLDRRVRVLVVRPCAGLEPGLDRALASLAEARTTASIACRFAVEDASDPAAFVAAKHARALRWAGVDASVVLTHADAPNHKAAQIEAVLAIESAPHDVLVIADSDVDLAAFDLDRLIAPLLEDASAGAIWAPPVEVGPITSAGDRASRALLAGSLHAFTLLGALDGSGLVGKLFAARSEAIRAVGGFGALSHVLGEDMELARLLIARHRTVAVAPLVARSLKSGRTWGAAADRYARWLTVIRAQRPHLLASYPLLFCSTPFLLLATALLLPFTPTLALATMALTLATRLFIAVTARALASAPFSPLSSSLDAVLSDALLTHAFFRALFTRTLTWRGRPLALDSRGALTAP